MIKILLILLGVVTAMLVTAYQSCGDIDFRMIVGLSTLWIGGPLLLITTLVGLYRTKQHGWDAWHPAGWVLAAVVVSLATHELSKRVLYWEEERAQAYPAQVEAELEVFRQSKGRYPNTLEELAPKISPPRLVRYGVYDGEYAFGMEARGLVWGTWHHDRKTKKWTYND
jgi:hypothetical protein